MALALDGSGHSHGSGTSLTVALSTTLAPDVIVVVVLVNDVTVTGVSSANTTGWTRRAQKSTGATNYIEEWYGTASGALSSETITVSLSGSSSFITVDAFGVSGADTTTIWDANAALPNLHTTTHCTITTSTADDFLIGAYRFGGTPSPTQGTGWTIVSGADYLLTQYKIVAATQSALDVPIGTGDGDENAGIGDAIIQATAGGGVVTSPFWYARAYDLAGGF